VRELFKWLRSLERILEIQGEISVKIKRNSAIAGLLVTAALLFAACGDSATSTPIPQPTTAAATTAAATTAANANGNGAAGNAGAQGGPNRGNFNPPLNGTIESYDAATKSVSVKGADGQSQKLDATNARVSKLEKINLADLGSQLTANDVIQVAGQPGSDGSYNATRLTILDPAAQGGPGLGQGGNGGPAGANGNGTPGQGRGQGRGQGQFSPPPNFTPGAGGNGRFGGANGGVIIRNASLSGNKLSGTGFNGEAVTVNLTDSTVLNKRAAGTLDDLKAGSNVSVTYRPAQGNTPASAVLITLD
jgi:hypothetical protein